MATPIFFKDVLLTIASTNFQAEVSSVTFTPTSSTATWQGLTPTASYSATSVATWSVEITHAQDWDTANSLSRYLFNNEGTTQTIVFRPRGTGYSGMTASCIITPSAVGGGVNAFGESTVSLPLVAKPTVTA